MTSKKRAAAANKQARPIRPGDRVHIPYNEVWEGRLPRWIGVVEKIIEEEDGSYTIRAKRLDGTATWWGPASHCRWVPQHTVE